MLAKALYVFKASFGKLFLASLHSNLSDSLSSIIYFPNLTPLLILDTFNILYYKIIQILRIKKI